MKSAHASTPSLIPADTPAQLQALKELPLPAPVSYAPQTIGWLVVALLLLAAIFAFAWRALRRYRRARYRREALVELAHIEAMLADDTQRAQALTAIAPLIKRTALAAAPRARVASLSGPAWLAFLHETHTAFDDASGALLHATSYAPRERLAAITRDEAERLAHAARDWIEHHHVEV